MKTAALQWSITHFSRLVSFEPRNGRKLQWMREGRQHCNLSVHRPRSIRFRGQCPPLSPSITRSLFLLSPSSHSPGFSVASFAQTPGFLARVYNSSKNPRKGIRRLHERRRAKRGRRKPQCSSLPPSSSSSALKGRGSMPTTIHSNPLFKSSAVYSSVKFIGVS